MVIISALVGAATFSQWAETYPAVKTGAGLLSLAVAILSGISTFLNPNDQENAHLSAAHGFDELNNDSRLFWSVDCWQEDSDAVLTTKLKELVDRKKELNSKSPQIPDWAYRKAKAGIEAGEAKFEVDKEKQEPSPTSELPSPSSPTPTPSTVRQLPKPGPAKKTLYWTKPPAKKD